MRVVAAAPGPVEGAPHRHRHRRRRRRRCRPWKAVKDSGRECTARGAAPSAPQRATRRSAPLHAAPPRAGRSLLLLPSGVLLAFHVVPEAMCRVGLVGPARPAATARLAARPGGETDGRSTGAWDWGLIGRLACSRLKEVRQRCR